MTSTIRYGTVLLACLLLAFGTTPFPDGSWLASVAAHDEGHGHGHGHGGVGGGGGVVNAPALGPTPCVAGFASVYPCARVDLESFTPLGAIGGGTGNDIWGWTDHLTGKEYAIVGRSKGTSFVDVSDPGHPIYLGNLPTHTIASVWRSIKVYADHAFISSEATDHGLQVFDLTQLRAVSSPPVTFTETTHYAGFGRTHTMAINEATGFLYATGSNTCSGGLHMVDVRVPDVPTFAGCFAADGYTHETQCVLYAGPDIAYSGRELCFSSNEDTLTIVDVTDKGAPVMLSRTKYAGRGYTHQGWLTDDHRYFLLDDEKDEILLKTTSRTYMWDLVDVSKPVVLGVYQGSSMAIDHNLYIRGPHAFEANYASGLRVLDTSRIGSALMREIGFFDVRPEDDQPIYNGSWTSYPFFASGIVVVNSIERGLFVVRPNLNPIAGADLIVSSLSSATQAAAGGTLSVNDTTTNQGGTTSAASTTTFYLSSDPFPGGNDAPVGSRSLEPLAGDVSHAAMTTLTIPGTTPAAKYFLLGVADANGGTVEAIENNNSRPQTVNIGPDLVITKLTGSTPVAAGGSVTVSGTTKNNGIEPSTPVVTRLYLSTNGTIGNGDIALGSYAVPSLAQGEVHQTSVVVSIPSGTTSRVYYLIGHVDRDGTQPEYDESNNTNKYRVTVQ
jgi:choice-of-anchor B domain-containing protein